MDIKHNTKTVKSKIIIKITNNRAEEIKRTKKYGRNVTNKIND